MDSLQADATRLHIGHRKQFFFDNLIVEAVQNLTRRMHSPQKVKEAPLIQKDQPWERVTYFTPSSWQVIRDPADDVFKCWYEDWQIHPESWPGTPGSMTDPIHYPSRYLFARSDDGIQWEKPQLDIYQEEGRRTNVVLGDREFRGDFGSVHCGYVFRDLFAEDDEERFKILFNHRTPERRTTAQGYYNRYAASPDGIHWKPWGQEPRFGSYGPHLGDAAAIFLDLDERNYILNTRHRFMGNSWIDPSNPVFKHFSWPYYPGQPWRNNKRRIFQARSADLLNWSEPQPIVVPDDELDNVDDGFYAMTQYDLGGMWVGFLDVFHDVDNTMDVQLVYSRDGRTFERLQPGRPWLATGEPGSWDQFMVNVYGGPVAVDDELYIYHGGAKNHHDWWVVGVKEKLDVPEARDMDRVSYCLGLARMKIDRFVSLSANAVRPGILVTKPFYAEGGKLLINARCNRGGSVQVAAASGDGQVISGFEKDNCVPFAGDSVAHQITWKSKEEVPEGWLKLHFYLEDADLYTFQVGE